MEMSRETGSAISSLVLINSAPLTSLLDTVLPEQPVQCPLTPELHVRVRFSLIRIPQLVILNKAVLELESRELLGQFRLKMLVRSAHSSSTDLTHL